MTKSKSKKHLPSTDAVSEKNIDLLIYELAQASQCEKVKPEHMAQLEQLVASTPPVKVHNYSNVGSRYDTNYNNVNMGSRKSVFASHGQEDDYTSTGYIRGGMGRRGSVAKNRKYVGSSFDAELGRAGNGNRKYSHDSDGYIDSDNHVDDGLSRSRAATEHHGTSRTVVTASERDRAIRHNRRIDVINEVYDGEDFMQDLFNATIEDKQSPETSSIVEDFNIPRYSPRMRPDRFNRLGPINVAFDKSKIDLPPPRARRARVLKDPPLTPKRQAKLTIESNRDLCLEEDVVVKLQSDKNIHQASLQEGFLVTEETALARRYENKKPKINPQSYRTPARDSHQPVELPPRPKSQSTRARVEFIVGFGKRSRRDDD